MQEIISGAGIFIYPLAICSLVGVFVIVERAIALRRARVLPSAHLERIDQGHPLKNEKISDDSVLGRLAAFAATYPSDEDGINALARLEINRMERGFVFLEIIISAAPLLGLLGTVTGLIQVFSNIAPDTGMPEPSAFVQGVALALTTTVLGLAIAIPCLVANSYFQRKVETFAVQLGAVIEQVQGRARKP
jgi:biopolymer transport protein ExbB